MSSKINWGIIAAGGIAKSFAKALPHSKTGTLLGIASRSQEKADAFAKEFNVPRAYGSYEAILADKDIQAVYISTPHPQHAEWAIKAAKAGKHILCEKPIALNQYDTQAIIEAARANNVFLMEAFMYRCHPQIAKLIELIKSKAIGDVKIINATFGFNASGAPATSRIWANDLAGGGILDVGCYAASAARLIAGVANGLDGPAEPLSLGGAGKLSPVTGVDDYAFALLKFPGDIVAQIGTAVGVTLENNIKVTGSGGTILVHWPWIPAKEGGTVKITLHKNGAEPQDIQIETTDWLYALEADVLGNNLAKKQAPFPAMSWDDTLGNMRTLDLWRNAIGLLYNSEKPENLKPAHGGKVTKPAKPFIPSGKVPGLAKLASRLVLGVDNQMDYRHAAAMFDDFFERGGNVFDTAHLYGGGVLERNLGTWIKSRGVRNDTVILGKGAHTPWCNPKDLTTQLHESLERLGVDHVDIYMMHRDNLDIPVAEFMDVLNEHVKAGRIKVFGGSNWSLARVAEANEYAKKKGLQGFSAVSNNFSLAVMNEAIWAGCIHVSDDKSIDTLTKSQIALMPWSSQARGFFTDRYNADDAEMKRVWISPENLKRRDRAYELAKKKGCQPINIALAYVLHQPFPTFALVGPRTIAETASTVQGVTVTLTPAEVTWLRTGK